MAPIKPHWVQPSHPDIQQVIVTGNAEEFTTKSISKIALPPFGLFARLDFPPCTPAPVPTYATVQIGRDKHIDLNSDLLYINHSCEPSLIFDTSSMLVIAGPKGLKPGDELTFFYPSTEWEMAQPFDCLCGAPTCRGRIAGARDMSLKQLEGLWLNRHIRDLLEERERDRALKAGKLFGNYTLSNGYSNGNGYTNGNSALLPTLDLDQTVLALREALAQAEKVVEVARSAITSYAVSCQDDDSTFRNGKNGKADGRAANGSGSSSNGNGYDAPAPTPPGLQRRGPTSRELAGEEGGDTSSRVRA